MSDYKDLDARCLKLLDTMANDPERPFWQLELVRITMECLSAVALLRQQNNKTAKHYAELLQKVEQLENRYSELLYRFSELKDGK